MDHASTLCVRVVANTALIGLGSIEDFIENVEKIFKEK